MAWPASDQLLNLMTATPSMPVRPSPTAHFCIAPLALGRVGEGDGVTVIWGALWEWAQVGLEIPFEELASLFPLFREAVDCPRTAQWESLANHRHAEG